MGRNDVYRNRVAIVTGGASGIGAAIGRELADRGARVVLADRQHELAESVASTIRARGGDAIAMELDVRDLTQVTHVVESTVARWGAVHYFFNNAGIGVAGEVMDYEPEDWDDVFDVNLRGVAYGIQAVYPVMRRQREGHIVNTASIAGLLPTPLQASYTATKFAVVGLSQSLRVEAARHGVRVTVLCPGVIRTPILTASAYGRRRGTALSDEDARKMWERLGPIEPDVFARAVVAQLPRNPALLIVPSRWKLAWYFERFAPGVGARLRGVLYRRIRASMLARARGVETPKAVETQRSSAGTAALPSSR